eukprot:TRINITY_DN6341_c0_g2_i9.p1 TRINITY_DN6341_c0_g2~~TRINITY_DN6341_c0_g2_i9.p1  ORF type:complete len:237 (+),score=45.67 TRINITY_DN6341_c0_g2_i9:151-861(+)
MVLASLFVITRQRLPLQDPSDGRRKRGEIESAAQIYGTSVLSCFDLFTRYSLDLQDGVFNESYMSTIGVDFKIKSVNIQGKLIKFQIWDTAGQERFKTIISSYYKGSHGVLLVYDITDHSTFVNIENWLRELELHADPSVMRILVGNKNDLESKRKIDSSIAYEWAEKNGLRYFEASAKSGDNVQNIFEQLGEEILAQKLAETKENDAAPKMIYKGVGINDLSTSKKKKKEKENCC